MAKYKKRADGRYYTTIQTNEINPETGERIVVQLSRQKSKFFIMN